MPTPPLTIAQLCAKSRKLIDQSLWYKGFGIQSFINQKFLTRWQEVICQLEITIGNQPLSVENTQPLLEVLAMRESWIYELDFDNTIARKDNTTIFCLEIAALLEEVHEVSRYQLLMPRLVVSANDAKHTLKLPAHHWIRIKDRLIPILSCLETAENDGILKHTSHFANEEERLLSVMAPRFTEASVNKPHPCSEAGLIVYHSPESEAYYKACVERHEARIAGPSLGTTLMRFAAAFRAGNEERGLERGARQERIKSQHKALIQSIDKSKPIGDILGSGNDAGTETLLSVFEFAEWFRALEEPQQIKILNCEKGTVSMIELWNTLTRNVWEKTKEPAQAQKVWNRPEFQKKSYDRRTDVNNNRELCVDSIGKAIKCIVDANPWLYKEYHHDNKNANEQLINHLDAQVNAKKMLFMEALADPRYKVNSSYGSRRSTTVFLERYAPHVKTVGDFMELSAVLDIDDVFFLFSKLNEELQTQIVSEETTRKCHEIFQKKRLAALSAYKRAKKINTAADAIAVVTEQSNETINYIIKYLEPGVFETLFKDNFAEFLQLVEITKLKAVDLFGYESVSQSLPNIISTVDAYLKVYKETVYTESLVIKIAPHLVSLVKDYDDFLRVYNSIKAVYSADRNGLHLGFLEDVVNRLNLSKSLTSKQFAEFLSNNNNKENALLIKLLGDEVVNKIDTVDQLIQVLTNTSAERCPKLIEGLTPKLLALIDTNDLIKILNILSPEHQKLLILQMSGELPRLFNTIHGLINTLRPLNPDTFLAIIAQVKSKFKEWIPNTMVRDLHRSLDTLRTDIAISMVDECLDECIALISSGWQMVDFYKWVSAPNQLTYWQKLQPRLPELIKSPAVLSSVLSKLPASLPQLEFLKEMECHLPEIITRSRHFVRAAANSSRIYQAMLLEKYKGQLVYFCCPTAKSANKRFFLMLGAIHSDNHAMLLNELITHDALAHSVPTIEDKIRLLNNVKDLNARWCVLQYFLDKPLLLNDNIKTIADYKNILELCPLEHQKDFLEATSGLFLSRLKTPGDVDLIQKAVSNSNVLYVLSLITPQKWLTLYRPEMPLNEIVELGDTKKTAPKKEKKNLLAGFFSTGKQEKEADNKKSDFAKGESSVTEKEKQRVSLA